MTSGGWWIGPALALAAFAVSALTFNDPGITIDEPTYVASAKAMREWFCGLASVRSASDLSRVFSRAEVLRTWTCHGVPGANVHPPGLQYLHNLIWLVTGGTVREPGPGRLGGAALLGLCAWALFSLLRRQHGPAAGVGAAIALVTMPRVFGHSHLAATDFPLLAGWLLGSFAWLRAVESRRWAVGLVPILAFTLLIKFTALAVFVPLWAWTLIYQRRRWRRFLLVSLLAGVLAAALDAHMWHAPLRNLADYVRQSTGRERLAPIASYYQGRVYEFRLPWHNGFVLTAITVPAVTLALAAVGLGAWCFGLLARHNRGPAEPSPLRGEGRVRGHGSASDDRPPLRRRSLRNGESGSADRFGTLCVINVVFFLVARMLPAPGHDGVRLFLPMFAFVAGLAGIGLGALGGAAGRLVRDRAARAAGQAAALAALLAYGLLQVAPIHPLQLSYYNELVGGLSGAVAHGYQATYWYDALTRPMYREMGEALPQGARVLFIPHFDEVPKLAQENKWLRADIQPQERPPADFVLLLFRQDWLNDATWALYRGQIGQRLLAWGYDGVPLVTLHRYPVGPVTNGE